MRNAAQVEGSVGSDHPRVGLAQTVAVPIDPNLRVGGELAGHPRRVGVTVDPGGADVAVIGEDGQLRQVADVHEHETCEVRADPDRRLRHIARPAQLRLRPPSVGLPVDLEPLRHLGDRLHREFEPMPEHRQRTMGSFEPHGSRHDGGGGVRETLGAVSQIDRVGRRRAAPYLLYYNLSI